MSHVRKQIRDAAIAAIKAGVSAFGDRVDKVRGFPRNMDRLPAAEVSTPGEDVSGDTMDGVLTRDIELTVTIFATGDVVEDQCDALAVGVEKALYGDATVMGLVKEITPESMAFEITAEGERRTGRMVLSWSAQVQTFETDPETAI